MRATAASGLLRAGVWCVRARARTGARASVWPPRLTAVLCARTGLPAEQGDYLAGLDQRQAADLERVLLGAHRRGLRGVQA